MLEGTVLANRYRLDAPLGEGGLSTVWRAWDQVLERQVAVKILRPELVANPSVVEGFKREAHAAAKLSHPHIVQIFDTGYDEAQGMHYLVMEYLPHPDFKVMIQRFSPLVAGRVVDMAIQCCRALAYAHRQGLVHRDVKPHNILFTEEGLVKLSDFGIAGAIGESGAINADQVLGSATYISPEQAQGRPTGPGSDLYSLGCVMFEALTGRPPYRGESVAQVAAAHVHEPVPSARALNPQITPAMEFVLNRALVKDPARRYPSAEEMLGDLVKLGAGGDLEHTGVLPRSEERTMPLAVTPAPMAQAPAPRSAPMPVTPSSRPMAPVRGAGSRPDNGNAVVWYTVIAVVVAIAALLATIWMVRPAFYPGVTSKVVQVPALKGHDETDARQRLVEAGLQVGRIEYRSEPDSPAGIVVDQNPAAGTTVPEKSAVDITLNRQPEIVAVPNLVEMDLLEATVRMKELGLSIGKVEQRSSDTVAKGLILSQSIAAGTKVSKPTDVDVVVSAGPEAPPPPEQPPTEGPEVTAPQPQVDCTVDEGYSGADPRTRRYLLTVTVMGEKEGQRVRVVKRDEAGGPVVVMDETLDPPSTTKPRKVLVQGNGVIQVYHEGKQVQEIPLEAPAEGAGGNGRP